MSAELHTDDFVAVPCVTAWTGWDEADTEEAKQLASDRDVLFRARVHEVLATAAPWLMRILREAQATIVTGPGKFFVYFRHDVATGIEIPELGSRLLLLPWQEDGQEVQ